MLGIVGLLILLAVMLVAAIPLTIAVKLMGGEASLMKVVFANILVGVIVYGVKFLFASIPGFVSFVLMLFIYKVMFKLGWLKTFFAWLLQIVVIIILTAVLTLLGVAAISLL